MLVEIGWLDDTGLLGFPARSQLAASRRLERFLLVLKLLAAGTVLFVVHAGVPVHEPTGLEVLESMEGT